MECIVANISLFQENDHLEMIFQKYLKPGPANHAPYKIFV